MVQVEPAPATTQGEHLRIPRLSALTRTYLFLLFFALPIDYFQPTGTYLREGGARPGIPLMVLGTTWIVYRHWRTFLYSLNPLWRRILILFASIALLGAVAFAVNVALGISYWDGTRKPSGQFVTQTALFVLVPPVLVAHAWLFSQRGVGAAALRVLPKVVFLHLLAIGAQAVGILNELRFPLNQFHSPFVHRDTPSGLMTEVSYVGAMAGMYGLALAVCMPDHKLRNRLLGAGTVAVAVILGGKTLVPALLVGIVGYAYQVRARLLNWKTLTVSVMLAAFAAYITISRAALNVRDNLSSAMRLGSTMLAYNVAKAGYGVVGIGFGQFHFLYRPKFAPWFLTYSSEANYFFSRFSDSRASTYDLPIRFLVETGILGFIAYLLFLFLLFRSSRAHRDLLHAFGAVVAASSFGFLFTQDPYFFPAFVCGAAMMASSPSANCVAEV